MTGYKVIRSIDREHSLNTLLTQKLESDRKDLFLQSTIKFLFYSPEELTHYMRLCDMNLARGYNSRNLSMIERTATWDVKLQLYCALKEKIRRRRELDTLDFMIGDYSLMRLEMSQTGERDIRDLGDRLDTRTRR